MHHYSRSANNDKVAHYLGLAGKQSFERFAFTESHSQLEEALEVLRTLPESDERDKRELDLLSTLVQVLRMEGDILRRNRLLRQHVLVTWPKNEGNFSQLILELNAIRLGATGSGEYSLGAVIADQILDLARRDGGRESLFLAHGAQLHVSFWRGDLVGVIEHFARMKDLAEADDSRQIRVPAEAGVSRVSANGYWDMPIQLAKVWLQR